MTWLSKLLNWIRRFVHHTNARDADNDLQPPDHQLEEATGFIQLVEQLITVVESGEREKSERLLRQLRQQFPVPTIEILRQEVWETNTDQLVLRTHDALDIEEAVHNVEVVGRKLSSEEVEHLQRLASHWCAWSPTSPEHRNDPWVRYLRYAYPSLTGLQPVFDSLIWPNEISRYPIGHIPMPPWLFLLATKEKYYVYNFQYCAMMEAGDTLMEASEGMMKQRWTGEDKWTMLLWRGMKEPCDYFPVYDNVKHTMEDHPLERELKEFTL